MASFPAHTEWTALPHSKMQVENTAEERSRNEPPVNHRLQRLVARRAGLNPRAAWFRRSHDDGDAFPALLVCEDWQEQADHDLCQRYLSRKSPRLLMLHGLSHDDRERLEIAAKTHAVEVDQYFPLYPDVNDERRMSALRVEARFRRETPHATKADSGKDDTGVKPLSKDLRILE